MGDADNFYSCVNNFIDHKVVALNQATRIWGNVRS